VNAEADGDYQKKHNNSRTWDDDDGVERLLFGWCWSVFWHTKESNKHDIGKPALTVDDHLLKNILIFLI